jgi:hypothetical protein
VTRKAVLLAVPLAGLGVAAAFAAASGTPSTQEFVYTIPAQTYTQTVTIPTVTETVTVTVTTSGTTTTAPPSAGPVFPTSLYAANSPWNTPLPADPPIHPDSAQMIGGVYTDTYGVHAWVPQGGVNWLGPRNLARNFAYVATATAVTFRRPDGSTITIPLPAGFKYPATYETRTSIQVDDGRTFILYHLAPPSGGGTVWTADLAIQTRGGWQGRADYLDSRPLPGQPGFQGAAGFNFDAGIVMPDELQAGLIRHALHIDISSASDGSVHPKAVYPADPVLGAGWPTPGVTAMPVGARVQLDPAVNCATWPSIQATPWMVTVCKAAQTYGAIVGDTATHQGGGDGFQVQLPALLPAGYTWPWGTAQGYQAGLPADLMARFRVIDWRASLPGINS